jgi:hypothetical protein
MKTNINNNIRIKSTDYGKRIINQQQFPYLYEEDDEGWSDWQLWVVMFTFGKHMYNGAVLPFETEIEVLEK